MRLIGVVESTNKYEKKIDERLVQLVCENISEIY